jgi:membrane fusion protein, multidrug efflux system
MRPAILISLLVLIASDSVAQSATSVRIAPLIDIATYPTRSAPATATSVNTAEIASEIGTRIKKIHVKVGDIVAAGAPLASLDCDSFNYMAAARSAHLDALKARLELATLKLKRTQKLAEKQSVSDEILDERKSELDILQAEKAQVRAEYRLARLDVYRCKVAAPFRALVTERIAADGEFVQRGDAIVRVLDIDNVEVSAQIQLGDAEGIQASKDLWFEYASKRYPVVVRAALGALNTATRNQEIRLEFENDSALPGAGGQLFWQDKRPHIPGNLLVRRDDRLGLFRLKDNRASFVPLPGAATGRAVPVDFPMDTQLILEGYYGLSDGDLVSVDSP